LNLYKPVFLLDNGLSNAQILALSNRYSMRCWFFSIW